MHLPKYITDAYIDGLLRCIRVFEFPETFTGDVALANIEYTEEKERQDKWEHDYSEISQYRIAGMESEKNRDIDDAITNYIKAISLGECSEFHLLMSYAHAYERLIICLHKTKDYEREAEYIKKYITYKLEDKILQKYTERLNKLLLKLNK